VIHAYGQPDPPVPRLLAAVAARGHEVGPAGPPKGRGSTLVLGGGGTLDPMALGVLLGAWRTAAGARVLVLSRIGAHPDARAPGLRTLWRLEEHARASGLPVLTLRLAPLLGPASPLWLKLREGPRLPRKGRQLLNPVAESDAVETIVRALEGRVAWDGWYEVAGPEALSLAELAELARGAGAPGPAGEAEWEPPLRELEEQRLSESGPWCQQFGLAPRRIRDLAKEWAK
jgi:uncharacterized protein YbjT (DUF2867 family)